MSARAAVFCAVVAAVLGAVLGFMLARESRLPDVRACMSCVRIGLMPVRYDEDTRLCLCGGPIQRCRSVNSPDGSPNEFCR